ncbi:MAG: hypothetical protein PVI78_00275 [Anaerolineales bacterium]
MPENRHTLDAEVPLLPHPSPDMGDAYQHDPSGHNLILRASRYRESSIRSRKLIMIADIRCSIQARMW